MAISESPRNWGISKEAIVRRSSQKLPSKRCMALIHVEGKTPSQGTYEGCKDLAVLKNAEMKRS
jgi:hypothetical protein